ncbi:hypothetical protein [Francisella philomiragia]|uniref:Uncharacterized protein n=1 Tax=Francisella philomiragia TaxID=28110 RepID=A0ABS1GA75_9GAMM|nr:hypothetical protein [Francisella philomiragia]MBK2258017.1 hypothetical protein [Francisella philomiragia]MBK2267223.1 hypothetical protein [Francisella philomiragia]MBK2278764.1 hypothetical protein [Francisella philomiragia]MBK2286618.1 hypothetical protein [Francisella philomiragia]MBK2288508.1 hypothetical protein [Francisella philomiragia]
MFKKQEEQREIIRFSIKEYIKLNNSYNHGIGVDAAINRILDTDSINQFIINFVNNEDDIFLGNETISLDNALDNVYSPKKCLHLNLKKRVFSTILITP